MFEAPAVIRGLRRRFTVVQCLNCNSFSLYPRLPKEEILSLYSPNYEPYWKPIATERNLLLRWSRRRHYAYRCRAVYTSCPEGGQVLDVGCGTGGFLYELQRTGKYQVIGIDINEYALSLAQQQGIRVQYGELVDLCFPAASFDVVTAWEVIEHVRDPEATLGEIHRVLKPTGTLLLSTPNGASWQARFWRNYWCGWDLPRHLQIFSRESLYELLRNSGFRIIRNIHFPTERYYFVESARLWLKAHVGPPACDIMEKSIALAGLALWPIFRMVDRSSSSSTIVVEARSASH